MPANLIGLPERITYNRGYVVGVAFIGLSLFATLILLTLNSELSRTFPYFFLLPWILLLLFVLILPSVILFRHGKFNLGNPLVFATWSYFFPAFVLGGIALAVGWSQPYFLSYIQDAKTNLPWTIILIMLGYLGLAAGYFLPIGKAAGRIVGDYFTISSTTPISSFMLPGMLLLLVGILNSAIALELGVIGYQGNKEVASYDGLIILSTLFWLEATFVLWYVVFKSGQVNVRALSVVGVLITTSIFKASYSGNRGSLLQSLITVLIAFTLSGRSLTVKRTLIGSVLLILLLIVGMIYGTTFRNVRGDQTVGGIDTYTDNVIETIRRVNDNSGVDVVEFGLTHLAERLDVVSSLAVVVPTTRSLRHMKRVTDLIEILRRISLQPSYPVFFGTTNRSRRTPDGTGNYISTMGRIHSR